MTKELQFAEFKGDVAENLEAIELNLVQCSDEKMLDFQNIYYTQIVDLIEETKSCSSWADLSEIISKAKTLELDVANWLARHGKTSVSLPWPKIPMNLS